MPSSDDTRPEDALQCAALPYRRGDRGELTFCLITSRGSRQWLIPKGKPIAGLTSSETAAREAYEEAGLIGHVTPEPIGRFAYIKDRGTRNESYVAAVDVFAMEVTQQLTLWPEMGERQMLWLDLDATLAAIEIKPLRKIVRVFADSDKT